MNKYKIILDTNVLVSGLRSRLGASFRLLLDYIITFNTANFLNAKKMNIKTISPKEFLQILGEFP